MVQEHSHLWQRGDDSVLRICVLVMKRILITADRILMTTATLESGWNMQFSVQAISFSVVQSLYISQQDDPVNNMKKL